MELECCLLYSAVNFFAIFCKSDDGFHWNGLSICVFTNLMNNSKIENCGCLLVFLLIILEMCLSVELECAACVCFFKKPWVWERICSKFLKPWEMKNLLWDREKGNESVTYGETVRIERSDYDDFNFKTTFTKKNIWGLSKPLK